MNIISIMFCLLSCFICTPSNRCDMLKIILIRKQIVIFKYNLNYLEVAPDTYIRDKKMRLFRMLINVLVISALLFMTYCSRNNNNNNVAQIETTYPQPINDTKHIDPEDIVGLWSDRTTYGGVSVGSSDILLRIFNINDTFYYDYVATLNPYKEYDENRITKLKVIKKNSETRLYFMDGDEVTYQYFVITKNGTLHIYDEHGFIESHKRYES